MEQFQSAYKPSHSNESALLKVQDEILHAIGNDQYVILLLPDLSAAFDTVDHCILLARLTDRFGVDDKAHDWFKSYLSGRMQFVAIGSSHSSSLPLNYGVPQGSVSGPILYLLYVDHWVTWWGISTCLFTFLLMRVSFMYHWSPLFRVIFQGHALPWNPLLVILINGCYVINLNSMMIRRRCWLFMLGTVLLPSSVNFNVATSSVTSSASAKNIGVLPNSTPSLDKHVKQICKSSFYSIRNTSCIRKFLSLQTAKILFHAFVTSKLDNCNSMLYGLPKNLLQRLQTAKILFYAFVTSKLDNGNSMHYGLPKNLLQRLQYVLNSAAGLVTMSGKSDHVTLLLLFQ